VFDLDSGVLLYYQNANNMVQPSDVIPLSQLLAVRREESELNLQRLNENQYSITDE